MTISLERGHLLNRLAYLASIALSLVAAFLLRFDFAIPADELEHLAKALLVLVPVKVMVFHIARLHRTWDWFTDIGDVMYLLLANGAASIASTLAIWSLVGAAFPRSIHLPARPGAVHRTHRRHLGGHAGPPPHAARQCRPNPCQKAHPHLRRRCGR